MISKNNSLQSLINVVKNKKGKFNRKDYLTNNSRINFTCIKGHSWNQTPRKIKTGSWCPTCAIEARRVLNIHDLKEKLKNEGYKLKRPYPLNKNSELLTLCPFGHEWTTIPDRFLKGNRCFHCARIESGKKRSLTIDYIKSVARSRGGFCRTKTYQNNIKKLEFSCSQGHEWKASASKILSGQWCPKCSSGLGERIVRYYFEKLTKKKFSKSYPSWLKNSKGNQLELDGFNEKLKIAFEHQGKQHYKISGRFDRNKQSFIDRQTNDLIKKKLCKKNNVILIEIPELFHYTKLSELKYLIEKELNKYKIDIFPFKDTKLPAKVFTNEHLEKYNKIKIFVEMKKGILLSKEYISSKEKLHIKCKNKHEWWVTSGNLFNNKWCPHCARNVKYTLEYFQKIAGSRNGILLSKKYINAHTKMNWICEKKHYFEMSGSYVIQGYWCKNCKT